MSVSTFKTNPVPLHELLQDCHEGILQLPDFQRSWVWDEERILSLIASISRAFPVGALMTLGTGGEVNFKPRPVEGAPERADHGKPKSLLLDGQQRMTSLYQVSIRGEVVSTITPRNKRVKRWFYIDMLKALDTSVDREESILGVPENRMIRSNFGKKIDLDVSTRDKEIEELMYPVSMLFRWNEWQKSYIDKYKTAHDFADRFDLLSKFESQVLENFTKYQVPVIALDESTSKEAVCVVFEKVNTGGKPLDAFELITAMYAADGYELRKDWYGDATHEGRVGRFRDALRTAGMKEGILAGVGNTDFLHVISLFHTRDKRRTAESIGKVGNELPQITGNRAALLSLPLDAYKRYQAPAEEGFMRAAKFLHMLHIYRIFDLPYQSQLIPLAAILADLGDSWEAQANRSRIEQWYWNGVFGELYGSTTETRIARDFIEVPLWLAGGAQPTTDVEATFMMDRLKTMRMRLSAAYKGVNALLMAEGARDFRSGQKSEHTVFFDEGVDIHHIFPQKWCETHGVDAAISNSIVNKTPLTGRTNRIIGGVAPSSYIAKLEHGDSLSPPVNTQDLDDCLVSHLIDPGLLRADDFGGLILYRQRRLVELISKAIGKAVYMGEGDDEGEDVTDDLARTEAEQTLVVAGSP